MKFDPKSRFLDSRRFADSHRELVVSDSFRTASESALLHFVLEIPAASTDLIAAANWHRVEGAREFLKTLINLAEVHKAPPAPPPQNLNHSQRT